MKTGRTLPELAVELRRQAETKKDYIADTRALNMRVNTPTEDSPNGQMILDGVNGGMTLRPIAHQHLAESLRIPKAYYDRLLADAPNLLAKNVNHWLFNQPSKKMIRTLDNGVRAILSDSYRPLDNYDLAEAVLPKLGTLNCRVVSCEVTDSRFYLKAITDKVQGEVKKGDVVQAGIVVSNSEVGQGALRIEALDFRLVCTNGMIRESAVRKAHLGRSGARGMDAIEDSREFFRDETRRADDKAFFLKVQDAASAMFDPERFNRRLLQYQESASVKIDDPVKVVEVVSRKLALNDGEKGSVLKHLIEGGDLSVWGLSNAVTRTAEDADQYDRATEIERLGGLVIEQPSEWKS